MQVNHRRVQRGVCRKAYPGSFLGAGVGAGIVRHDIARDLDYNLAVAVAVISIGGNTFLQLLHAGFRHGKGGEQANGIVRVHFGCHRVDKNRKQGNDQNGRDNLALVIIPPVLPLVFGCYQLDFVAVDGVLSCVNQVPFSCHSDAPSKYSKYGQYPPQAEPLKTSPSPLWRFFPSRKKRRGNTVILA